MVIQTNLSTHPAYSIVNWSLALAQVKMQSQVQIDFSGLLNPLRISCKWFQQAQFLISEIKLGFFFKKKNEIFK